MRISAAVLTIALIAVACSSGVTNSPVEGVPSPSPTTAGGDGIPPVDVGRTALFIKGNTAPMDFRQGSRDLVQAVGRLNLDDDGLLVTAIKTTEDAAGVFLVEDAPDRPWGSLLTPAQSQVFDEFEGNTRLGQFLILVTDVVVHRLQDPVAPTAYRWSRGDVEAYVACGMPADTADPCRQSFFRAATTVVLQIPGRPGPGK